jgi:hypothetical protein
VFGHFTGESFMATTSQSLVNLSVPTSDGSQNMVALQPKLSFRFRLTAINFGAVGSSTSIFTRQVREAARPSVSFTEVSIPMYNSTVYVAGKHEWAETSVTLVDDANGSISQLVAGQLQKQLDFAEQSSQASGSDYKFMLRLEMLDGGNGAVKPQILETWEMYGCFIKSANYNQTSYTSNDAMTISLGIRFDNALQVSNGLSTIGPSTGVGA